MGYPELDAGIVAERLGLPLSMWAGNCHGISQAILEKPEALGDFLPNGAKLRLVRGHWVGPITIGSYFGYASELPFVQHSWLQAIGMVIMPEPDVPLFGWDHGLDPNRVLSHSPAINDPIIDPTRFAFDGRQPYVYIGPSDHYDPGGNILREHTLNPCPPFKHEDHIRLANLPAATDHWIAQQIVGLGYPYGYYTFGLCMWLANLPLQRLGQHAEPIFRALIGAGQGACIPIDNRNIVLSGGLR